MDQALAVRGGCSLGTRTRKDYAEDRGLEAISRHQVSILVRSFDAEPRSQARLQVGQGLRTAGLEHSHVRLSDASNKYSQKKQRHNQEMQVLV